MVDAGEAYMIKVTKNVQDSHDLTTGHDFTIELRLYINRCYSNLSSSLDEVKTS
uniref:Uncharacterized protein n=1 Tax=Arundo donax TaxID=35708 RepID=A0A0A9FM09_ARUDO